MNLKFIIIQIIGLMAWVLIIFSYYRKNTNKILLFHMFASIFFAIHYFLLKAYGGFIICFFELIRDYLYYKSDKDHYIFLFTIFFYAAAIIFTYDGIISVFPFFASFFDGFFLTKERKIVIFGSIIIYILWFLYDFFVNSYSGMLFDIILVSSNLLIILFNYSIFSRNNGRQVIVKR